MTYRRPTRPTKNPSNQVTIDYMLEAYDLCKRLEGRRLQDDTHRHCYNNAINALRECSDFVCTLDKAKECKVFN